jgi:hypothetical protein
MVLKMFDVTALPRTLRETWAGGVLEPAEGEDMTGRLTVYAYLGAAKSLEKDLINKCGGGLCMMKKMPTCNH